jgi:hypothetical protein
MILLRLAQILMSYPGHGRQRWPRGRFAAANAVTALSASYRSLGILHFSLMNFTCLISRVHSIGRCNTI